jgi:hypothetical protein
VRKKAHERKSPQVAPFSRHSLHDGFTVSFASLAFSRDGKTLYVSNLSLYLPYAGALAAVDSAWTLLAGHYTVSAIPAVVPRLEANRD